MNHRANCNPCALTSAAIVCGHIARQGATIEIASRDAPEEEEDSGWQFLCGWAGEEHLIDAQVWSVQEVLKHDPTVTPIIDSDFGTRLVRRGTKGPWKQAL